MAMNANLTMTAVNVIMDRIGRFPSQDRSDFVSLYKQAASAATVEERIGIRDTMVEILDGRGATIETADLAENHAQPESWVKWVAWVSTRIREARTEAGFTQEQLAARYGLPQSHISRIENAKHSPARGTLEKIAKVLSKPMTFFDFY